jgi:putative transposase
VAYATHLTDDQWQLVCDLFDPPGRRGAPARIPRRRMVAAILYQTRTGCQWRYLPTPFGPWGAIWQQFRRWRDSGVWEQALVRLRRVVRTRAGRDPEPSMVMLDCRTVKGGRGGPGFHEAGGKYGGTFGAKRTLLIDYLGLPVAARVDSARPHDSRTGRMLLDDARPSLPRVTAVLADLGFEAPGKGIKRRHEVTVTIKGRRKPNPRPWRAALAGRRSHQRLRAPARVTEPVAGAIPWSTARSTFVRRREHRKRLDGRALSAWQRPTVLGGPQPRSRLDPRTSWRVQHLERRSVGCRGPRPAVSGPSGGTSADYGHRRQRPGAR